VVYALGVSKKVANDKGGWPKANDPAPEHLLLDPPTLGESMASDWQTVQGKDPLPGRRHDIPLMTEDGLKDFVLGCCNGHIFTSNQVPDEEAQHLLGSIFMPLVFGALKNYDQESIENIGVLWEHMSEAAPRGINGGTPTNAMVNAAQSDFFNFPEFAKIFQGRFLSSCGSYGPCGS